MNWIRIISSMRSPNKLICNFINNLKLVKLISSSLYNDAHIYEHHINYNINNYLMCLNFIGLNILKSAK